VTLKGRTALVVGLGKSGVAAARLLVREGADVAVADAKPAESLKAALEAVGGGVRFVGAPGPAAFAGRDLIVKSPGVPPAAMQGVANGAEVIGEAELASRFIREPVIGITGTNGKSTTTALTGHLLKAAGLRAFVGGNLGTALSERVLDGGELDATVCELSSFQLEDVTTFRCAAAAVLNITPDHLDRYSSLIEYAAAKERIFLRQQAGDLAVLNGADDWCRKMTTAPGVARAEFSSKPQAAGRKPEAQAVPGRPNVITVSGFDYALRAKTLRGAHNGENAMAALLLAGHLGAVPELLQQGLDTYPGLPHRLEPVRTLNGVEYINDSKATNVDSVEKSLGAFPANLLLILGGRGKGASYAPLRPLFAGRVKALFTIGEDARRIEAELGDAAELHRSGDLRTAVLKAHSMARPGDVVLLSPACASYDQFKNFEDRGQQFKQIVGSLT